MNVGRYIVAAAHFHIINIICIQTEEKQSKRKVKNKSVDLTHDTPPRLSSYNGETEYRLITNLYTSAVLSVVINLLHTN